MRGEQVRSQAPTLTDSVATAFAAFLRSSIQFFTVLTGKFVDSLRAMHTPSKQSAEYAIACRLVLAAADT